MDGSDLGALVRFDVGFRIFRWVLIDGGEREPFEVAEEVDGRVDVTCWASVGVAAEQAGAHVVGVGHGLDDGLCVVGGVVVEVGREFAGATGQALLETRLFRRLYPVEIISVSFCSCSSFRLIARFYSNGVDFKDDC